MVPAIYYATTSRGGAFGDGVVHELPAGSSTITVLDSFNGTNGSGPYLQTLVMDGAGNLYGTTQQGTGFSGSVFEVATREPETVIEPATPTLATATGGTVVLGIEDPLTDSATLAGGDNPTGTITFVLTAPDGSVVDTETDTVSGNGTYGTPIQPDGFVPTVTGTYQWSASYSGDSNNNPVSGPAETEMVVPTPATPTLTTTPGGGVALGTGTKLTESATLAGGVSPTGIITFTLYAPNGTTVVDTETDTVAGNGIYTTPTGFVPTVAGNYQWSVQYSGDNNNSPASAPAGLSTAASFTGGSNGGGPEGGVVMDSSGDFFGTTPGMIYELAKGSSTITVLASFTGNVGDAQNGVIMDSAGDLFGTAQYRRPFR